MPKKKDKILEEKINNNYKVEQIIYEPEIYSILYDEKPFSLKIFNKIVDYPGPKYKKMFFFSLRQATNFSKKLNEKYKTDKFKVVKVNFTQI